MQKRITYSDRESWLAGRKAQGIGASSAAAIVGLSKWQTPTELWKELTGQTKPKDLSDDFFVQRGNQMEDAIRYFFQCRHPEYQVEYHQFDLIYQEERPWLFATLDGEFLYDGGKHGILEIKTAQPKGKAGWDEWNGKVPQNYFCQILHQFLATGYDMAILCVALYGANGDITIREYEFYREEHLPNMDWLLTHESDFWNCVQKKSLPPLSITVS